MPRRTAPRSSASIRALRAPRPRPTSTTASAPAPDVAFLMGMLHHIFKNGWEDKDYIKARVYGMDKVREEAAKWTPDEGRRSDRHEGSGSARRRRVDGQEPSQHDRVGDGPDSAHERQRNCTRVAAFCNSRSATSAWRAAAPTFTAATTTCRARPTSGPIPIRCRAITVCCRDRGTILRRRGASTSNGSRSSSRRRR